MSPFSDPFFDLYVENVMYDVQLDLFYLRRDLFDLLRESGYLPSVSVDSVCTFSGTDFVRFRRYD